MACSWYRYGLFCQCVFGALPLACVMKMCPKRIRHLPRVVIGACAVGAWIAGCSPKPPAAKSDQNPSAADWEYVAPSGTHDFIIRVKIDTVRRVVRWMETKPASDYAHYEECSEKKIDLPVSFWIFDDQNWWCDLEYPSGEPRLILWMQDGKLRRLEGGSASIRFERRPRLVVEQQAAPTPVPSARQQVQPTGIVEPFVPSVTP